MMMRPRYLLFVQRTDVRRPIVDEAASTAMRIGLSEQCLFRNAFLLSDTPPFRPAGRNEMLIGTARERQGISLSDRQQPDSIRDLCRTHWGQFVGLAETQARDCLKLLRDPSGFMPCYYAVLPAGVAITSDVDLLFEAGLMSPKVDREALVQHLRAETLRTSSTCQEGVLELYPGWVLETDGTAVATHEAWSPFDSCFAEQEIRDPTEAARGLRKVVDETARSLAEPYAKILLSVSGGLDSSVVACALANAGADLECVTLATEEAAGDERGFARLLTQTLGLRLHERFEDTALIDLTRSDSLHLPRPVARSFSQSADRIQSVIGEEIGAQAYFHGGGGDNVLCYMTSSRVITDRLVREGWKAALRTSLDMIQLTGGSFLEAWRGALRRRWFQGSEYHWPQSDLFLLPGDTSPECHPWLKPPPHCLPGKALHVAWLVGITNRLEGYDRERRDPLVAPLLAQPIVEYCLRIPTWLWCKRGINRAIARDAYADMLPPILARRTTKGTPSAVAFRLIEDNRDLLAQRLGEGRLAQTGIVDIQRLLAALHPSHAFTIEECVRISALNDAESWVRGWEAKADKLLARSGGC